MRKFDDFSVCFLLLQTKIYQEILHILAFDQTLFGKWLSYLFELIDQNFGTNFHISLDIQFIFSCSGVKFFFLKKETDSIKFNYRLLNRYQNLFQPEHPVRVLMREYNHSYCSVIYLHKHRHTYCIYNK